MYREEIVLLEKETAPAPAVEPTATPATQPAPEPVKEQTQKAVQATPKPRASQKSLVIEKPNYDFIESLSPEEEKKVYKIDRKRAEEKPSTFAKRLRTALFALVVGVCSIWGIINIVDIANLQSEISAVSEQYKINLANYLLKLGTIDSANSYNELFETYPETPSAPSSIAKQSNWFDRLCNFIARLFGG